MEHTRDIDTREQLTRCDLLKCMIEETVNDQMRLYRTMRREAQVFPDSFDCDDLRVIFEQLAEIL